MTDISVSRNINQVINRLLDVKINFISSDISIIRKQVVYVTRPDLVTAFWLDNPSRPVKRVY